MAPAPMRTDPARPPLRARSNLENGSWPGWCSAAPLTCAGEPADTCLPPHSDPDSSRPSLGPRSLRPRTGAQAAGSGSSMGLVQPAGRGPGAGCARRPYVLRRPRAVPQGGGRLPPTPRFTEAGAGSRPARWVLVACDSRRVDGQVGVGTPWRARPPPARGGGCRRPLRFRPAAPRDGEAGLGADPRPPSSSLAASPSCWASAMGRTPEEDAAGRARWRLCGRGEARPGAPPGPPGSAASRPGSERGCRRRSPASFSPPSFSPPSAHLLRGAAGASGAAPTSRPGQAAQAPPGRGRDRPRAP